MLKKILGDQKTLNRITRQYPAFVQKILDIVDNFSMRLNGIDNETAKTVIDLRNKLRSALQSSNVDMTPRTDLSVENNNNSVYNDAESEANAYEQRGNLEGNFGKSRLLEERKQNEIKYREWEQSITTKEETELTSEEREISNYLKNTFNIDLGTSIKSLNKNKEVWTSDGRPQVQHKP